MTFTLFLKNCSFSPIIQRCNTIAVLSHFYSKDHTMISCNQSVRWRSSLIYNMNTRNERHECNKSNTSWYKCDTSNTSATQTTQVWRKWKMLILIMPPVKTYFHTPILTSRSKNIWKVNHLFMSKAILIIYTLDYSYMVLHVPTKLRIVT